MSAAAIGLIVLCALCAAGGVARAQAAEPATGGDDAQPTSPRGDPGWDEACRSRREPQQRARDHFRAGNQHLGDGLYGRAVAMYEQAIAVCPHSAIYYNLAFAQIALDQPIQAYASMQRAIARGLAPLGPEKYEHARRYLELLERQQARVEVSCDTPGVRVTLDGELLFVAPGRVARLVRPGAHQLVASKDDFIPDARELVLSSGQHERYQLAPLPVDQAFEGVRRWPVWQPWLVVGAGVGLVAAAGYLDWRSSAELDRYDAGFVRRCPVQGCVDDEVPDLADDLDHARGRQQLGRAAYLVGGAALVTGVVLVYLNRERLVRVNTPGTKPERDTHDAGSVRLIPVLTPREAGISAQLNF